MLSVAAGPAPPKFVAAEPNPSKSRIALFGIYPTAQTLVEREMERPPEEQRRGMAQDAIAQSCSRWAREIFANG